MITRTVQSPAGETITLYTDAEFRSVLDDRESSPSRLGNLMQWSEHRRHILGSLYYDGPVHDQAGRASTKLLDRAIARGLPADTNRFAATNAASSPAIALCVERDNRGTARRTFTFRLAALPDSWYRKLLDDAPVEQEPEGSDSGQSIPPGPAVLDVDDPTVVDVEPVVPAPPALHRPVLEIEIANSVATAMLTQVIEIIAAGSGGDARMMPELRSQVIALEDRLGHQVGYVDKLRRQLSAAGDEINALKHERDGLRQRARTAEYNLSVATGADAQRIIDVEVRRQLDRIMRQSPVGEHSKAVAVG